VQRSIGTTDATVRWSDAVRRREAAPRGGAFTIGVLPGEGIGPEVTNAALRVLSAIDGRGPRFEVRRGGPIGREAELLAGRALPDEVAGFCEAVFADGGAVLAGAGGGRFVYDLRKRFDLFCKFSPLRPRPELEAAGRLKPECVRGVDVLLVRENVGGVYMGEWREHARSGDGRVAEHAFSYCERHVRRVLEAAAAVAVRRSGRLAVTIKESGVPGVSALWRELAEEVGSRSGVEARCLDIDLASYLLVQEPRAFDVVVSPNLFGDILADVGTVLLGSRGLSFSGNFSEDGAGVYQTNHGAARDLAGTDRADPIAQISSLAMMLAESFGLAREAAWIEASISEVLSRGFRTFDIAGGGTTIVGTEEMAGRIADAVDRRARFREE
jgi:3-isopropylmalate dehydrogenase